MNFDEFLKEKEKIEKLSIEEQKKFYEQLLKNKHDKTELYVYASFYYGHFVLPEWKFWKSDRNHGTNCNGLSELSVYTKNIVMF